MKNNSQKIIEFTLIYNQHKKRLYNYAIRMLYDKMLCEDLIQNVFIRLFENLDKIRDKERVEFWLFTSIRNEIYSYFRTKKVHVDKFNVSDSAEVEIDSGEDVELQVELNEIRNIVLEELEKIPLDQKEVFVLKEYGQYSYKEISELLGIPEELVKSRLHKTRVKLVSRLTKKII
ncbi:MAG: RNA polymerase sigma factor [Melioribacteraceae bacterium]|nr:RNA polymerase sigma factor [Melioribacteraceae bacterium]